MTGAADRGIRLKPMGRRARPPGGVRRPLRPRRAEGLRPDGRTSEGVPGDHPGPGNGNHCHDLAIPAAAGLMTPSLPLGVRAGADNHRPPAPRTRAESSVPPSPRRPLQLPIHRPCPGERPHHPSGRTPPPRGGHPRCQTAGTTADNSWPAPRLLPRQQSPAHPRGALSRCPGPQQPTHDMETNRDATVPEQPTRPLPQVPENHGIRPGPARSVPPLPQLRHSGGPCPLPGRPAWPTSRRTLRGGTGTSPTGPRDTP